MTPIPPPRLPGNGNLVLTRRVGEEVLIGSNIIVRITEIDRNQVKLAIMAPTDLRISRSEPVLVQRRPALPATPPSPLNGEKAGMRGEETIAPEMEETLRIVREASERAMRPRK